MAAKAVRNRRKSFRIDTHLEAYYYLNGSTGVSGTCSVVNYCHGGVGVLFRTAKNIHPGSVIVIKLASASKARQVTIKGKLAYGWKKQGMDSSVEFNGSQHIPRLRPTVIFMPLPIPVSPSLSSLAGP